MLGIARVDPSTDFHLVGCKKVMMMAEIHMLHLKSEVSEVCPKN
jgi:hypothetical protein